MIETNAALSLKETQMKLSQIMKQKINEYDLNMGLLHLTILVQKYPGASQKDLASKIKITEGAFSTAVKRLINLDILKQEALEEDLRYNRLIVTQRGKELLNDYQDYIIDVYKEIFIGLDDDELALFNNYLQIINQNLEKINTRYNRKNKLV
jgi:DNA-binding MarR family transcriptional regulator